MRARNLLLAMLVAVVTAVGIPGAAQANFADADYEYTAVDTSGQPPSGAACSVGTHAAACFEKYGDELWVRDKVADGRHVDLYWTMNTGDGEWDGLCHNRNTASAGWTVCDGLHDLIPENELIHFRAFVKEHGGEVPVWTGGLHGALTTTSTS